MLLVVEIVSFIAFTVWPNIDASTVHDAVQERAMEYATISPLKAAVATHLVIAPHACVLRAIGPEVATFTLFSAIIEHSKVETVVGPDFNAQTILLNWTVA